MQSIDKVIARVYILLLPLRMLPILEPIFSVFGAQAQYLDVIFLAIGITLHLIAVGGRIQINRKSILWFFIRMIGVFCVISVIMAIIVYCKYGLYNGNSPFVGVGKLLLDFVQYALIIWYVRIVFTLLGTKEVFRFMRFSTVLPLLIGYLQIAQCFNISQTKTLLNGIGKVFAISLFEKQIALTFSEPSHAAMFIGIIVLPLIISDILLKKNKLLSIVAFIIWLPIIIYTKSTTAYLVTLMSILIFVIIVVFQKGKNNIGKAAIIIVLGIVILGINSLGIVESIVGIDISYLIFGKVTDLTNQSTFARFLPLVGDAYIFLQFPFFGCGNGLQGYFFKELIPSSVYRSHYLEPAAKAIFYGTSSELANGQLFFPGVVSGYGIVGLLLMGVFLIKSWKAVLAVRKKETQAFYFYMIAFFAIIVCGFKSEFIGNVFIWTALAIPYAVQRNEIRQKGNKEL